MVFREIGQVVGCEVSAIHEVLPLHGVGCADGRGFAGVVEVDVGIGVGVFEGFGEGFAHVLDVGLEGGCVVELASLQCSRGTWRTGACGGKQWVRRRQVAGVLLLLLLLLLSPILLLDVATVLPTHDLPEHPHLQLRLCLLLLQLSNNAIQLLFRALDTLQHSRAQPLLNPLVLDCLLHRPEPPPQ